MSTDARLRFNKKALENVPLPQLGSRLTFHDSEVPGLQLRVTDRGIKSFCVFRRSKRGAPERITIGRFPTLSVERARAKAKRYLAISARVSASSPSNVMLRWREGHSMTCIGNTWPAAGSPW
jgi:hypothetical protein